MSHLFNEENGSTTIVKKPAGDTGVTGGTVIQNEAHEARSSDAEAVSPPTTPAGRPEYEVKWDTLGHFRTGQVITGSQYGTVKEEYDIRMKDWAGTASAGGVGIFHISGGKRDQVKRFLEEKRYVLTSEYYHYIVRAQGKKVDPAMISQKIQDMGLKFIWVHVSGPAGPDKAPRKMRLNRL
jgi:hypothetical protein